MSLAARAVREDKNLEILVTEIIETAAQEVRS
jgi:hypothetical protein